MLTQSEHGTVFVSVSADTVKVNKNVVVWRWKRDGSEEDSARFAAV